jgi:hypothetical protein
VDSSGQRIDQIVDKRPFLGGEGVLDAAGDDFGLRLGLMDLKGQASATFDGPVLHAVQVGHGAFDGWRFCTSRSMVLPAACSSTRARSRPVSAAVTSWRAAGTLVPSRESFLDLESACNPAGRGSRSVWVSVFSSRQASKWNQFEQPHRKGHFFISLTIKADRNLVGMLKSLHACLRAAGNSFKPRLMQVPPEVAMTTLDAAVEACWRCERRITAISELSLTEHHQD